MHARASAGCFNDADIATILMISYAYKNATGKCSCWDLASCYLLETQNLGGLRLQLQHDDASVAPISSHVVDHYSDARDQLALTTGKNGTDRLNQPTCRSLADRDHKLMYNVRKLLYQLTA